MRPGRLLKLLPHSFGADGYLNRRGAIFLCSHMRGYTTLLAHLLGSHPEIAGYAEMHQNYRNTLDFIGLAAKIAEAGAGLPQGRRLLDKILHPCRIADGVLKRPDLALLIAARPPQPTLASIIRGHHGGIADEAAAADYYLARLRELQTLIERRGGRVLYLDSEALIAAPETTLAGISGYLGLSTALAADYRRFPLTGVRKFGDPSARIHSGRIDAAPATTVAAAPSPILRECERAYAEFRRYARRAAEQAICPPDASTEFRLVA